jgi:tRNA(His) 5'-end guanylyltransferase
MSEEQNGNGKSRLDRLEGLMELLITDHVKFSDEHNKLLTSQILLTDRIDKLTGTIEGLASSQDSLNVKMKELADSRKQTDERMNILIQMMDEWIRRHPLNPSA